MTHWNPDLHCGSTSYLSVDSDELSGVALRPRRQDDVAQLGAVLFGAWFKRQRAEG